MTAWESLEDRRLMSAGIVTQATVTSDQLALSAARAALTVAASTDQQQIVIDQTTMRERIADAQLSLRSDQSAFAQTFADDRAALVMKLAADRSVLLADAQIAHSTGSAAMKATLQADRRQMVSDQHTAVGALQAHRAQANITLAQDRAAIAAAHVNGLTALRADAVAMKRHQVAAQQAVAVAQVRLAADERAWNASAER